MLLDSQLPVYRLPWRHPEVEEHLLECNGCTDFFFFFFWFLLQYPKYGQHFRKGSAKKLFLSSVTRVIYPWTHPNKLRAVSAARWDFRGVSLDLLHWNWAASLLLTVQRDYSSDDEKEQNLRIYPLNAHRKGIFLLFILAQIIFIHMHHELHRSCFYGVV